MSSLLLDALDLERVVAEPELVLAVLAPEVLPRGPVVAALRVAARRRRQVVGAEARDLVLWRRKDMSTRKLILL